jgi:hypothetical protein
LNALRRLAAIVAVITVTAAGLVLTGVPAHAALPYCNNISGVDSQHNGLARYQTYVSGSYTVNCNMARINVNGNAGERRAISQLQWDLNMCYGKGLGIDGEYGELTREAVRQVQRHLNGLGAGLTVDGWAGPRTRSSMQHVVLESGWCEYVQVPVEIFPGYEWLDYQGP